MEHLTEHVWRLEMPVATLPPYDHTNAYLIADNGVGLLVDPAFDRPEGPRLLRAAMDAAGVRLLKGVVVTHTHPDHVAGLAEVVAEFDRPAVYVHAAEASRLAASVGPVVVVVEDRVLTVGDVTVELLHTPGHSPGHLSLLVRSAPGDVLEAALAGDLVAASGSIWVGLPEGDVARYLHSLDRLARLAPPVVGPGHGPAIREPVARLIELREHRLARERQVLAALAAGNQTAGNQTAGNQTAGNQTAGSTTGGSTTVGSATVGGLTAAEITATIYPEAAGQVLELASRSVEAHLAKLVDEGRVTRLGPEAGDAYALTS